VANSQTSSTGIDVLNTSVTEIMILGIFFILLAFAIKSDDLKGATDTSLDMREEIIRLEARLKALEQSAGMPITKLAETLYQRQVRITKLEAEIAALSKLWKKTDLELQSVREELRIVKIERDKLIQKLDSILEAVGSENDIEQIVVSIKRIAAANSIDPDAPIDTLLSQLEKKIGTLSSENYALREKLKTLRQKYGLKGEDAEKIVGEIRKSGCWKKDDSRPDALFNILIRSDGFRITSAWPKIRELDAISSSAVRGLVSQNIVSEKQFRKLGKIIRAESESRPHPCIFVVNIDPDNSKMPSAIEYKKLSKVTGYFFYPR
jgi:regulator of replication initiation timing